MFAYIRGRLDSKHQDSVTIEAGGVGYRILTALSTLSNLPAADGQVKLYTHFSVREDAHVLYGFMSKEELAMFETLLSVSGVGPKAALSLLSALLPSQFSLSVLTEDAKLLTRAQGVGNKLAQKIVFELRDKMKKELGKSSASSFPDAQNLANLAGGAALTERGKFGEAVEALMVLGCSGAEANQAVSAAYDDGFEIEEIIRRSLVYISR